MLRKRNSALNETITTVTYSFDRNFDNTVVDTFAFDKVLHSETLTSFLCDQFTDWNKSEPSYLRDIARQSSDFIIHEVEDLYANTDHRVLNQKVYYDYTTRLISKIAACI